MPIGPFSPSAMGLGAKTFQKPPGSSGVIRSAQGPGERLWRGTRLGASIVSISRILRHDSSVVFLLARDDTADTHLCPGQRECVPTCQRLGALRLAGPKGGYSDYAAGWRSCEPATTDVSLSDDTEAVTAARLDAGWDFCTRRDRRTSGANTDARHACSRWCCARSPRLLLWGWRSPRYCSRRRASSCICSSRWSPATSSVWSSYWVSWWFRLAGDLS